VGVHQGGAGRGCCDHGRLFAAAVTPPADTQDGVDAVVVGGGSEKFAHEGGVGDVDGVRAVCGDTPEGQADVGEIGPGDVIGPP
jgi:hypothetical protein